MKTTIGMIEDEQGRSGVVGMLLSFKVFNDAHDSNENCHKFNTGFWIKYYEIDDHYSVMDEHGNFSTFPLTIGDWGHKPTIEIIEMIEQELRIMYPFEPKMPGDCGNRY